MMMMMKMMIADDVSEWHVVSAEFHRPVQVAVAVFKRWWFLPANRWRRCVLFQIQQLLARFERRIRYSVWPRHICFQPFFIVLWTECNLIGLTITSSTYFSLQALPVMSTVSHRQCWTGSRAVWNGKLLSKNSYSLVQWLGDSRHWLEN